ncbi:MAG: sodium-dependent transporter [Eubacteriales bacterium]|nr:sodium-dependent transporter [Eubacteriales bacterium]
MKERESFGTRLGFILVSAGCAVGLGNVWKFPYICGQNGGAAFILIYLVFLLFLGLPILIAEFAVGRGSAMGPAKSYDRLEAKGTKWHRLKWASIAGNYLLMMFYTMVGGWMLYYVFLSGSGKMSNLGTEEIVGVFTGMLGSPMILTLWMVVAVCISMFVCSKGLQNGIEKITKVMMSMLIVLIVVLAVHSLFLPNAMEGVRFYLVPNMDAIRSRGLGPVVFDAMSHAFFTLSIGMGSMQIFGSYLKKDNTIGGEAVNVLILDTFVALMAGFIIIPACFAYGVQPDSGPALLFMTLPNVFNHMGGGRIWGTAFFVFMSFAALSTIIAVFENILAFYMDQFDWSRAKAVKLNVILIPLLSMPAILGFNILSGVQPMGLESSIMDLEDFLVSYNILPLGSMVYILFCTRKNGWGWDNFMKEANTGKGFKVPNALKFYMSYILPIIIVVIYLKGYYDTFAKQGKTSLIFWMSFAVIILVSLMMIAFSKGDKERNNK